MKKNLLFLLWSALFGVAYTQSPLYTSNQNQYFLHGFAQAGVGLLKQDWLANTHDPTPLFSFLVAFTLRFLGDDRIFYVFYALLMGVYLFSLLKIVEIFLEQKPGIFVNRTESRDAGEQSGIFNRIGLAPDVTTSFSLIILAFLFLQHSAGLRFLLSRTLGTNWTYLFEDGVADQRILGPVFQPSSFGVFLALSLALFLTNRPFLAVLCTVVAASISSNLPAASGNAHGYLPVHFLAGRKKLRLSFKTKPGSIDRSFTHCGGDRFYVPSL